MSDCDESVFIRLRQGPARTAELIDLGYSRAAVRRALNRISGDVSSVRLPNAEKVWTLAENAAWKPICKTPPGPTPDIRDACAAFLYAHKSRGSRYLSTSYIARSIGERQESCRWAMRAHPRLFLTTRKGRHRAWRLTDEHIARMQLAQIRQG